MQWTKLLPKNKKSYCLSGFKFIQTEDLAIEEVNHLRTDSFMHFRAQAFQDLPN